MPKSAVSCEAAGPAKGLHLYHYGMSNCSQRVRILLAEKRLAWTSHYVDLRRNEHAMSRYLLVNPAGLVPALVHGGQLITESLDILDYIDAAFPLPRLTPAPAAAAASAGLAERVQPALKLLSHEFLFRPVRRMGVAQIEQFAQAHPNQALVSFLRAFSSNTGFTAGQIAAAAAEFADAFGQLDRTLQRQDWLAGPQFSVADITWIPNVRRMELTGFPMAQWPALRGWYIRVRTRPSFKAALLAYEPPAARVFFAAYGLLRRVLGSDLRRLVPRQHAAT